MRLHRAVVLFLLVAATLAVASIGGEAGSSAEDAAAAFGEMSFYVTTQEKKLENATVMVTVMQNGRVVRQGELDVLVTKVFDELPPGGYEVRAESAGVETVVKKGVFVVTKKPTDVRFDLRPGNGVKVIEYAAGGLETLEARVAALEKEVAAIRKAPAAK